MRSTQSLAALARCAAPAFQLRPRGPFSWPLALTVLPNLHALRHAHAIEPDGELRLSFLLDGTHAPVAVRLRFKRGARVSARIETERAARIMTHVAAEHGHLVDVDGAAVRVFPTPARLLRISNIAGLGAEKMRRLHGVADASGTMSRSRPPRSRRRTASAALPPQLSSRG